MTPTDKPSQGTPAADRLAHQARRIVELEQELSELRATQQPTASEPPNEFDRPAVHDYIKKQLNVPAPSEQEMGGAKREELVCRRHDVYYDPENKICVICEMRAALQSGDNRAGRSLTVEELVSCVWTFADGNINPDVTTQRINNFLRKKRLAAAQTSDGERAMAGARLEEAEWWSKWALHCREDCKCSMRLRLTELKQAAAIPASAPAGEREQLAEWMITNSFATGHGDKFTDLLKELSWQVAELRGLRDAALEEAAQIIERSPTWNKHKAGPLCWCELCTYVRGNATEIRALKSGKPESALSQTEDGVTDAIHCKSLDVGNKTPESRHVIADGIPETGQTEDKSK